MFTRKRFLTTLTLAAGLALPLAAQAQQFFRIGTGGTAGTYYPVGGMIANVGQPARQDRRHGAGQQRLGGQRQRHRRRRDGKSGFSQADVATWAQKGTGIFEGKPNVPGLRLIANLYPESVHVVVRKGAGIKSVADLKGKRVALDEPGSGTLVNARAILAAYGIKESDIKPEYIKPNQAGDKMKDGSLDAFFFTGGAPAGAIAELASAGGGIDIAADRRHGGRRAARQQRLLRRRPDRRRHLQGRGRGARRWPWARSGSPATRPTPTRSTRSPRRCSATPARSSSPPATPRASSSPRKTPCKGAGIPFHPGAERFYKEAGLLK